jgi:hypothetical protein
MSERVETGTHTENGISLARGPALVLGTILFVAGLDGHAHGRRRRVAASWGRAASAGQDDEPVGARRR